MIASQIRVAVAVSMLSFCTGPVLRYYLLQWSYFSNTKRIYVFVFACVVLHSFSCCVFNFMRSVLGHSPSFLRVAPIASVPLARRRRVGTALHILPWHPPLRSLICGRSSHALALLFARVSPDSGSIHKTNESRLSDSKGRLRSASALTCFLM